MVRVHGNVRPRVAAGRQDLCFPHDRDEAVGPEDRLGQRDVRQRAVPHLAPHTTAVRADDVAHTPMTHMPMTHTPIAIAAPHPRHTPRRPTASAGQANTPQYDGPCEGGFYSAVLRLRWCWGGEGCGTGGGVVCRVGTQRYGTHLGAGQPDPAEVTALILKGVRVPERDTRSILVNGAQAASVQYWSMAPKPLPFASRRRTHGPEGIGGCGKAGRHQARPPFGWY